MTKFTQLFWLICSFIVFTGCSEPQNVKTATQAKQELKALNSMLLPQTEVPSKQVWPFTKPYLKDRDALFTTLIATAKDDVYLARNAELLKIEQRFTERFFLWPYNANPVLNYIANAQIEEAELIDFVYQVQQKMIQAANDKVRLSRIELSRLQQQVQLVLASGALTNTTRDAIIQLDSYLADYTPRRSPGIGGLPNGKDWYQARLNYFIGSAMAPNDLLNRILVLKEHTSTQNDFLVCFMSSKCSNNLGIDWRTDYSDRIVEFSEIPFGFEQVVIAEVDFGLHAQAWSSEHALTVLREQLSIDAKKADSILFKILSEPGLAMVNLPVE